MIRYKISNMITDRALIIRYLKSDAVRVVLPKEQGLRLVKYILDKILSHICQSGTSKRTRIETVVTITDVSNQVTSEWYFQKNKD